MQTKTKCPLWKKPTEKVCPTCEWYKPVRGKDPQTGVEIDEYRCSVNTLVSLMIENTREQRFTTASLDKAASLVAAFGQATAAHLDHVEQERKRLGNGREEASD